MTDTRDPKEKKKLQNRIAQRTHREKLKRRMQELERIAAEREPGGSTVAGSADLPWNDKRASWPLPLSPGATCYSLLLPPSPSSNPSTASGPLRRPSQTGRIDQPFQASCHGATSVDTDWPAPGRSHEHEDIPEDTLRSLATTFEAGDSCFWSASTSQNQVLEDIRETAETGQKQSEPERPRFPAKTAPVSDRLRCLKQCAEKLGFGSLDAALSAYYTTDLHDCPALHNERSLGRNRRLPTLFSEVHASSHNWNTWEQTGFQQEVLKAAEHFYVEECGRVHDVASVLGDNAQNELTSEQLAKAHEDLKNTVPNLWALLTGLAMSTANQTGQRQHPYTVFSILVMLYYPGKALPPEVLGWDGEGSKASTVEI